MANSNSNYTIIIKNSGDKRGKSPISGDDTESSSNKGKGILTKEDAKTFAKGMVAYGMVKSFATQVVNHEVSMVELRTGSNELQGRANFINNVGQKVIGIGESIVGGAMVGGLYGAIAGAVIGIAHTALGYAQQQDKLNTERSLENITINMKSLRAGVNNSRGNQ